ncbi:MAG: hypothetical protein ACRD0A_09095 [Acidimicrobiales bacterium]
MPSAGPQPSDEARLAAYATALADGIEAALPGWVVGNVERLVRAWLGDVDPAVLAGAEAAGRRAGAEVGTEVRALVDADVDEQWTSPLDLVRRAVRFPTAVLRAAGVPPVERDSFADRAFPDDIYDLAPASYADVDPGLAEAGIEWGAAKAHVVLTRRRHEGKR